LTLSNLPGALKVAYLFSRYPVPSQTFCDTEMRALEASGITVEIYSCSPPTSGFRHGTEGRPRAPVFYAPPQPALELWEAAARQAGRWPGELIAAHEARYGERYEPARRALHALYFSDLARRRGVDHLHIHFANRATHAALFIDALGGPPFSFTAHAQDFLIDLGSDALLGEMCARSAFAVAVSDWSRGELARRCPDSANKIHRVYNGLALEQWPAATDDHPGEGGPLRIFSVGRLIEFKGFADLINACAELKRRGVLFACEIAGEGPLREELERQIAALGVGESVRLLGLMPQARVREKLEHCDVFALACRMDARGACDVLPTVILEAMAAARPVVSTFLAGVPEMVDDGRTGRLALPGDVPALADALAELAADPALRVRYGRAGREKLEARFSATDSSRQLAELFHRTDHPRKLPRPAPPATARAGDGVVCLLAEWPPSPGAASDLLARWMAALPHLRAQLPDLRLMAFGCPAKLPAETREAMAPLVEAVEFLPDAMVLEGEWREQASSAHTMESWRGALGGSVETERFLCEARRALWLHGRLVKDGPPVRCVCAVGAGALLCAWLLARLGAASYGARFLTEAPASGGLSGSVLRRLAPGFAGGWIIGERKLAAGLGAGFRGDDLHAGREADLLVDWIQEGADIKNHP
jgi:glycosyltransferase involved in cell wall biosynthesis